MNHYLLILWLWLSTNALADLSLQHLSHQRHILPGERAAMVGGAFTALSDDASGIYYNPAGTVHMSDQEESVAVLLSQLDSRVEFDGAVNGNDFIETSSTTFAGITGGLARIGRFTFGYGVFSLDNKNINQNDKFSNISDEIGELSDFDRIHQETNKYDFLGAGVGVAVTSNISFGVSAFYYSRSIESMDYQLAQFNGTDSKLMQSITTKIKTENLGVLPIFGLVIRTETVSIGASIRQASSMSDKTTIDTSNLSYAPDDLGDHPVVKTGSVESRIFAEPNPATATLGLAFFMTSKLTLTTDVSYHQGVQADGERMSLEGTYNYALGMEAKFGPLLFAMGAFTNNSMYPELSEEETNQRTKIDYLGGSTGIVYQGDEFHGGIGLAAQQGSGKAQVIPESLGMQDVVASSNLIFLSSKIKF